MQKTYSSYRARSERRKIREFGAFRSRSRAVRPVTLRRGEAYLPETVVSLPWAQVLATIGASPAGEAGGLLEASVIRKPSCNWARCRTVRSRPTAYSARTAPRA